MNEFTNPDPYVNKTEDVVCRGCNKTFQINTSYDKNGFPVSFRPKYCTDCNIQVIKNNKLDLDVFKSAQTYFNDDQIGINLAHFALIKEIHKTLIIGFSVLVVFMLATWGYLTYTFFKQ